MSLFTVNKELCAKDGICAAVCPPQIITMEDEFPRSKEDFEELCLDCGHCVAVCPKGAMNLKTLSPDQCPPVNPELVLTRDHVEHLVRSRRSIRTFKQKKVDRELLKDVIDIARYGPTGSNKQPVKWLVLYEPEDVKEVADMVIQCIKHMRKSAPEAANFSSLDKLVEVYESGNDRICRGAPHLVFAHADASNGGGQTDCTIAMTYLELVLPSFGLGGCWAGYVNGMIRSWPPLSE